MGKNKNKQAGYSLLELMYVVSIISLLAAMLIPQLLIQKDRIIEAQAQRRLRTIGSVMADFALSSASVGFLEFQDLKDSEVIRNDFKLTYFIQDY
ncbi:type II secretion system protein, partial [bacterium]|nr:type II secretion system protein [bacterium]